MDTRVKRSIAVLAIVAAAGSAMAGLTGDPLTVTVNSDGKVGQWTLPVTAAPWVNGEWRWQNQAPIVIKDSTGGTLVTLESLSMTYIEDPVIGLNFVAVASNVNTTITFSSALLSFAAFNGEARASAAITATDQDGNGVTMNGLHAGGKAYRANLNGAIPGGTAFALLDDSGSAGAFSSYSDNESNPGGPGFLPVGVISSMQAQFAFDLTANDSASGTSVFVTQVPTPGALALIGFSALAAGRRRR